MKFKSLLASLLRKKRCSQPSARSAMVAYHDAQHNDVDFIVDLMSREAMAGHFAQGLLHGDALAQYKNALHGVVDSRGYLESVDGDLVCDLAQLTIVKKDEMRAGFLFIKSAVPMDQNGRRRVSVPEYERYCQPHLSNDECTALEVIAFAVAPEFRRLGLARRALRWWISQVSPGRVIFARCFPASAAAEALFLGEGFHVFGVTSAGAKCMILNH